MSAMHSLNTSGRSLIYIKNSVGASNEPWGTPETTWSQFESLPDTYVCWYLPLRKDENHLIVDSCIPYRLSFSKRIS